MSLVRHPAMRANVQPSPQSPDAFFADLFNCDAAQSGGIVQLSHLDMERFVGRDRFDEEMTARKFSAILNRGQIIIFCNDKGLRLIA